MASKTTSPATNGSGARKCRSWIDQFVDETSGLESPVLFRRWAAITLLGSILEQKVWLPSGGGEIFPNLYVMLIGHPGTGKTRAIRAATRYAQEIEDFYIAPTSMSPQSLVDALLDAKRMIIQHPDPTIEYNTMLIAADELGTFMHEYAINMVAVLSAFYDPIPYGDRKRGKEIKIKIKRPQLSMLCGSTPSNLLKFIPESAWDQGFTSRMIFVFSDEKIVGDDFDDRTPIGINADLVHDLKTINRIIGRFKVTSDFRDLVNAWRAKEEEPSPKHPKLVHYNTRRRVHFYKLCMISAIDRSNILVLTRDDFNRAMNWLVEAETYMPDIFKATATGSDSQAMEEIYHFVLVGDISGRGLSEQRLFNFTRDRVPAHAVGRVIDIMQRSGMINPVAFDKLTGQRYWKADPNRQK